MSEIVYDRVVKTKAVNLEFPQGPWPNEFLRFRNPLNVRITVETLQDEPGQSEFNPMDVDPAIIDRIEADLMATDTKEARAALQDLRERTGRDQSSPAPATELSICLQRNQHRFPDRVQDDSVCLDCGEVFLPVEMRS